MTSVLATDYLLDLSEYGHEFFVSFPLDHSFQMRLHTLNCNVWDKFQFDVLYSTEYMTLRVLA